MTHLLWFFGELNSGGGDLYTVGTHILLLALLLESGLPKWQEYLVQETPRGSPQWAGSPEWYPHLTIVSKHRFPGKNLLAVGVLGRFLSPT